MTGIGMEAAGRAAAWTLAEDVAALARQSARLKAEVRAVEWWAPAVAGLGIVIGVIAAAAT